ncbi:MAG: DUF881 domain-containing protein [Nocardioides sp.]
MADQRKGTLPDHVTTPLLTLITEHSLDDDYQEVAKRHGAAAGPGPRGKPAWVAATVVGVFGVLVATAAVQTSRNADTTDAGRASLIARVQDERAALEQQQATIADLQRTNIGLEDRQADLVADQRDTSARLRRLQVATGYTAVTGPGVRIVVDDAPNGDATQIVRDEDLALLVDGLWGAGAEAISINDQRLTALSAIRNVGPAVHVNSKPVNPPYTVQAIGDTLSLQADLLETSHGQQFFDLADDLGFVYTMQNENSLTLPAAPGPRLRHVEAGTGDDQGGQGEETGP